MNTDKHRWKLGLCLFICVYLCSSVAHSQSVSLQAVGDILLDRGVAQQMRKQGIHYPFQFVASTLNSSDLTFANLECPIAVRGRKVPKPFVFKAAPEFAPCLNRAGFDILSLSNNHTLDCGRLGLQETMATLRERKIQWCGAGENRAASERATLFSVRGVKIGFLAFCEFVPEGVFLNDEKPSIALADEVRVRRALQAAREVCDVLVVSFHWGIEYQNRPSARQKFLAREAARSGADLVLGHHPHVWQGLQILRGAKGRRTLVAYSLGNFVFDAPRQWTKATQDTAILHLTLDKNGVRRAQILPMKIENARPRPMREAEAKRFFSQMQKLSGELGTKMNKGQVVFR
jgi:poly-gamma-glutamate capsule biosynthesis protein CapA/YwtB (metallophosphatase superfamily)